VFHDDIISKTQTWNGIHVPHAAECQWRISMFRSLTDKSEWRKCGKSVSSHQQGL